MEEFKEVLYKGKTLRGFTKSSSQSPLPYVVEKLPSKLV